MAARSGCRVTALELQADLDRVGQSLTARYDSLTLHSDAVNGTPVELVFLWTIGEDYSLTMTVDRAFLPRVKTPIEGPGGIVATHDFMGSGQADAAFKAVLINDVESYA